MIENVRCIMKSKLQSDAAMIEIGGRHLDWLSMQNLDIATCWIYSKSVCIYSTSISLSNNRHRVSYKRVSRKDDGPTGQTTGQRGSDPSAYRGSKR